MVLTLAWKVVLVAAAKKATVYALGRVSAAVTIVTMPLDHPLTDIWFPPNISSYGRV